MAERATGAKRRGKRGRNGIGHNSGNVVLLPNADIPDEVRQRHLDAITKADLAVDRAKKPLKAAQAKARAARKVALEDGVHVDAMGDARKLMKRDRIDVLQRYQETGRFLRLMDSPLVTQLDLFKTADLPAPVSANLAGFKQGKAGDAFDCPHNPGTEKFNEFKAGWDTGQAELQEQLRQASSS